MLNQLREKEPEFVKELEAKGVKYTIYLGGADDPSIGIVRLVKRVTALTFQYRSGKILEIVCILNSVQYQFYYYY